MRLVLFAGLVVGEIFLQSFWIRILKRNDISQTLKAYGPQSHIANKKGTPTMGGVVFMAMAALISFAFPVFGIWGWKDSMAVLGFPLAGGAIGLADDLLKFKRGSSEGLRSLQKLSLQIVAGAMWAGFFLMKGGPAFFPGLYIQGLWGYLVTVFLLVGSLNAVNITDGLDGLASGACAISFAGFLVFSNGPSPASYGAVIGLAIAIAFLWHNMHPAKVFMGDSGSHFLGGLLISVCLAGDMAILIIPMGVIMGIEVISVIIQIVAIRAFGKRVFRMSPIHHHFELAGWSEMRVVTSLWLFHLCGMILLLSLFSKIFL
jgi:phospho-N-acetylmuramoyl-pentapeptide-transferase